MSLQFIDHTDAPIVAKPELTKAGQNYVDLHRHAAVRHDLLSQSGTALRLIAAHMIAGNTLWDVQAEPQKATKPEIDDSLAQNTAQQAFEAERGEIAKLLGMEDTADILSNGHWSDTRPRMADTYRILGGLDEAEITRILTFLMADSLAVGADIVEALAEENATDVAQAWRIDEVFFDLMRDKPALNAMVGEIAGKAVAKEHITSTAKTQKAVIKACLDGTRIAKIENWTPRYMQVPKGSYHAKPVAVVAEDAQHPEAA